MTSVMFLAAQAAPQGGNMSFLFLMIAIFAVMWFFMIRPQQKKQKEIRKFQNSLQTFIIPTVGKNVMNMQHYCTMN